MSTALAGPAATRWSCWSARLSPYGNRAAISYNYQPANAAKLSVSYNQVVTTKYYSFNGQRVALRKNGVLYYLHSDHPSASSGQAWAARH